MHWHTSVIPTNHIQSKVKSKKRRKRPVLNSIIRVVSDICFGPLLKKSVRPNLKVDFSEKICSRQLKYIQPALAKALPRCRLHLVGLCNWRSTSWWKFLLGCLLTIHCCLLLLLKFWQDWKLPKIGRTSNSLWILVRELGM